MLTTVYDFGSPAIALDCAKHFGLELKEGLGVSQSVFISGYDDGEPLYWRNRYSYSVEHRPEVIADYPADKWKLTVEPDCQSHVLTINARNNIYALVDGNGTLNIFVLESCPATILIDEECFNDEPPLYFTEYSHFISPVFKVNVTARILSYCLEQIGFPYIPVNKKVIFTSNEAELINRDDYVNHDEWKDVEIIMQNTMPGQYIFNTSRCLAVSTEKYNSPLNQLLGGLLYSLSATGIIFEASLDSCNLTRLDAKTLDQICKKRGIFI